MSFGIKNEEMKKSIPSKVNTRKTLYKVGLLLFELSFQIIMREQKPWNYVFASLRIVQRSINTIITTNTSNLSNMLEMKGLLFSHGSMVVSLLFLLRLVNECQAVYTPSLTWSKAHATFYGGSDASGTMGITPLLSLSLSRCVSPPSKSCQWIQFNSSWHFILDRDQYQTNTFQEI